MKCFILSFLTGHVFYVTAQQVIVKDAITQELLPHVTVVDVSKNHLVTTDNNGKAILNTFDQNALISFTHMGYETQKIPKSQIESRQIIWMTPTAEQLGEIVLSVSRSTDRKQRLAQQVGIISQHEISENMSENAAEMLRKVPGIRVQQSQGGGGSPVLRGFEANRVLLMVDGVRLNNAIFRSGHVHNALSVDPLSLSRAEVIFGPSSVGYGSDALGGVVHFYTRSPLINQEKKVQASGYTSYTFRQNTSKQAVIFEYSASKWGVLQYLSFSRFGDVVMGNRRPHGFENWGKVFAYSQNTDSRYFSTPTQNTNPSIQKNSGYHQLDLLQKWVYHTSNGIKFTLNFQGSQSGNIPRFDKLVERRGGALRFAQWEYGPQKRLLISPQVRFEGNQPWLQSGKIIAAVQFLEESRIQRKFSSLDRETQHERVAVFSLNADFKARSRQGSDWSYGLEATHNKVSSSAFSERLIAEGTTIIGWEPKTAIPTRYPSGGSTYTTFAAYTDYRYDINPKSTFSVGARHTLTELDVAWTEQALIDSRLDHAYQKHQSSNVTVGFNHKPNGNWQLKALFSTGFRAPNVDDLGKIRENNGLLSVPNVELKPEYIYSTDIGIHRKWTNGSSMELNGYYAFIRDYIARGRHPIFMDESTQDKSTIMYSGDEVQTIANINVGKVDVLGFSGQTKWIMTPRLHYQGAVTLTKGFGNELSGNLPSISPIFITQSLQWNTAKGKLALLWHYAGAKAPSTYSPWGEDGLEETPQLTDNQSDLQYAGTPAWHRWDMQFNVPIRQSLQLSGGIFNLWDTHYREFASGISAPGRSAKLALRYEW